MRLREKEGIMSQTVSLSVKYDISTGNIQELSGWRLAVHRGIAPKIVTDRSTKIQYGLGFLAAVARYCRLPGHGQANKDANGDRMVCDIEIEDFMFCARETSPI